MLEYVEILKLTQDLNQNIILGNLNVVETECINLIDTLIDLNKKELFFHMEILKLMFILDKEQLNGSILKYKISLLKEIITNCLLNIELDYENNQNIEVNNESLNFDENLPVTENGTEIIGENGSKIILNFNKPGQHIIQHKKKIKDEEYIIRETIEIDDNLHLYRKYDIIPNIASVENFIKTQLNNNNFKQILEEIELLDK